jgi:hypothetical protein
MHSSLLACYPVQVLDYARFQAPFALATLHMTAASITMWL